MIFLIIIVILCASSYFVISRSLKLNKRFYEVEEVYPQLISIYELNHQIEREVKNVTTNADEWIDWPEKYLYDENNSSWKIFPFYAFGTWVNKNCELCPVIAKYLKSIKGLKMASLSKLSPNLKLEPHQGYSEHSNYILRCHYPIIVPKKKKSCVIKLAENYDSKFESRYYKKFKWIIFDDSKVHYVENSGESDRIVLLIDIERPNFVEVGKATGGDTKELLQIVNYFRQNQ